MAQLFYIADLQEGPSSNQAMNRYWYLNPDTAVAAEDVGAAFANSMMELVRIVQSSAWKHNALYVNDVLNPGNSALITLIGWTGGRGPDSTPASNSWSFPMKPFGPTIKRGGKRIPGVAESDTNQEVYDNAVILGLLTAVALGLALNIPVDTADLVPVIVRELANGTDWLVSAVTGAVFRQIGTQVSRKLSRGGGTSVGSLVAHSFGTETATDISAFSDAQLQTRADDVNTNILSTTGNFATESTFSEA